MQAITVEKECDQMRLDGALSKIFPEHSRAYFQSLIDRSAVTLNGKHPKKRERVLVGDTIEVTFLRDEPLQAKPESIPLDILYEDDAILVVDKPVGMVVHPAPGAKSGTLVNAILHHLGQIDTCDDPLRPGIVHRLDKDTSGVIVIAKNRRVHHNLAKQFASRDVEKEYLAVTVSRPKENFVDAPIARDPHNRQQMSIVEGGREATTEFAIEKNRDHLFLVRAFPRTGRTHQIRVHLRHVGAPILGDTVYGASQMNRKYHEQTQLLHSHRLKIFHPESGERMTFETPFPRRFLKYF